MNPLQVEILAIYKEVKKICDMHQIRFFGIGGTCIGAVRHHGFIPWDDDIDLAMPRKDYERFIEIATKELPDKLKIFNGVTERHSDFAYIKVHNTETTFTSDILKAYPQSFTGVYVDIMPLDGVPRGKLSKALFGKKIELLIQGSFKRKLGDYTIPGFVRYKKLYGLYLNYLRLRNPYYAIRGHTRMVKKYDFDMSKFIVFSWCWFIPERIFHRSDFSDVEIIKFEDSEMPVPIGYDRYLRKHIGDYTSLPPENERVPKHTGIISLDTPYEEYVKRMKYEQ